MKRLTATVSSEAWKTRLSKGRSVEKSVKIDNYWRKKKQRTWTVSKIYLEQIVLSFWVFGNSCTVLLIYFHKELLRMGLKFIVLDG